MPQSRLGAPTEWQKEDTTIAQDDLYAYTWDTNFGGSPFDSEQETHDQQDDIVEYEPTPQLEIYRRPARDNFKNSGGSPAEQPAVNDEEPQIIEKTPSDAENHESIPEIQKLPKNSLPKFPQKVPKITQKLMHKTQKLLVQEVKNTTYAQNPNPNYSDSYRY